MEESKIKKHMAILFPALPNLFMGIVNFLDHYIQEICQVCKVPEEKKTICRAGEVLNYLSGALTMITPSIVECITGKKITEIDQKDASFLEASFCTNLLSALSLGENIEIFKVRTDSMSPAMEQGDFGFQICTGKYKEGDIIVKPLFFDEIRNLWLRGEQVATATAHRLIRRYKKGDIIYFVTKPDNIDKEDPPFPHFLMPFRFIFKVIKKGTLEHKVINKIFEEAKQFREERGIKPTIT